MMTFATAANQHHYHKVSGCSQGRKPNYQVKKKQNFAKENIPGILTRFAQQ